VPKNIDPDSAAWYLPITPNRNDYYVGKAINFGQLPKKAEKINNPDH
jgi:hypothetical protein